MTDSGINCCCWVLKVRCCYIHEGRLAMYGPGRCVWGPNCTEPTHRDCNINKQAAVIFGVQRAGNNNIVSSVKQTSKIIRWFPCWSWDELTAKEPGSYPFHGLETPSIMLINSTISGTCRQRSTSQFTIFAYLSLQVRNQLSLSDHGIWTKDLSNIK